MKIEFLPPAQQELDEAFTFYEYQQKGLGKRFVKELKFSIYRIKEFPLAWQNITKSTRRCLVKNFPYGVVYQLEKEKIIIVAIANLHRKPNYFFKRLTDV
ncbi:type II toxin-antitoxin system RelE/ParE family toxin [Sulfurimonas sp. MAG313]|nr:type II toxin-antitoxin system RelE/ParE family toxin [Sulfurimonas sp. MAG313]MDF1882109.1 type II toxin-antitoxin system RelE/ParE family toxin [Sulfurimonas sp. MAG313]